MLANGHSFEGFKYQISFYCSSKEKRKRKKKSNIFEVITPLINNKSTWIYLLLFPMLCLYIINYKLD